jgi:hypothetical protein
MLSALQFTDGQKALGALVEPARGEPAATPGAPAQNRWYKMSSGGRPLRLSLVLQLGW